MNKIIDYRGTGRTSRLITLAKKTGAIIVAPNHVQKDHIETLAKEYNITGVKIITFNDFLDRQKMVRDEDTHFLIDNLDEIMAYLGVIGYTELKEERRR